MSAIGKHYDLLKDIPKTEETSETDDSFQIEDAQEEEESSLEGLRFYFISKGKNDVIKAIEYGFIQVFEGRDLYNLGFGDYDIENDVIRDDIETNNGDPYMVFNTVLSTIPNFFEIFSNDMVMVQGSDSSPDFVDNCRLSCAKGCKEACKNFKRRINAYKYYVNKNYNSLIGDYYFFGGIKDENEQITIEPYEVEKNYDSVFLRKK